MVSYQLHVPASLLSKKKPLSPEIPLTGCMGPRAGLNNWRRETSFAPAGNEITICKLFNPWASHFTEWDIPASVWAF